ncbi:MAG: hypothetical protein DRR42_17805 [Gammaproteobacteria bacterium]|nr:MAG: hypothetical protein DRR42_17805 [Gammaproteobacteria bacterium]
MIAKIVKDPILQYSYFCSVDQFMPYCDDKQVIFLHVPKTGGTTIKRLFGISQLDDPDPAIRPSLQHLTCELLRQKIGDEKYVQYYKFAFVRNPWARIVSDYFWRQQLPKKRPILPFQEFVANAKKVVLEGRYYEQEFGDHFIPQLSYTVDIDDVFRFDKFEQGIQAVAAKLDVNIDPITPKETKPYDRYWEYYDDKTRSVIHDIYSGEIEQFGFEFGGC